MDKVILLREKKVYSRLALTVAITWILGLFFQIAWAFLLRGVPAVADSAVVEWLSMLLPLYLFAFPIGLTFVKNLPEHVPARRRISAGEAFRILCICVFLMYAGAIIGDALAAWLSGGSATNIVHETAMGTEAQWMKFLVLVVCVPFMEEIMFRKVILDRVRIYGETKAIVFSALAFGLFHMNFYQFFYAMFVGALLAYLYLRTGNILIPYLYHAFVNLVGGFLPVVMSSLSGEGGMTGSIFDMLHPDQTLYLLPTLFYVGILALFFLGLIFFLCSFRKLSFGGADSAPKHGSFFSAVVMNAGFLCLVLLSGIMSAFSLTV